MYLRSVHRENDLATLYDFIRENPLGVLTTALQSSNHPLLQSSHIPWVLDVSPSAPDATKLDGVRLRGHIARANPHAKALIEAATAASVLSPDGAKNSKLQEEVMVLFTSTVHHYVTPNFYVETKPVTGKVVPTWDYAAVQAYGTATVYFDTSAPETGAFLDQQLHDLTRQSEEGIMGYDGEEGRKPAWTVDEAPKPYVELLKKAIVGIEIEVTNVGGKWKMSQELARGDREGVIRGFEGLETPEGESMAKIVRERCELKDSGKS